MSATDASRPPRRDPIEGLYHNLTNHAPISPDIVDLFDEIRGAAKLLGRKILELSPESRERSLAITNLEQTVMWAVAGIARNQESLIEEPAKAAE